ncbi:hypothetical protein B0H94_103223 [Salsuginibacillus halophilus]|uniref:Uncharacterized protein n=1 Tax=Salsuginibacillus halophilus TaxID=517424 RepID=A0A2P8HWL5_9BACI|nr:CC/Se motif family (seleno)protein [Salsuginibacillus halophilus]PSL50610.1 hypothetical protein B0H94_103223 [Salsuginibacillus halophilus]
MKVNMNKKTEAWIEKNGGVIKLDAYHPLFGTAAGGFIDAMVAYEVPENTSDYQMIEMDNIQVFVHESLNTKEQLTFHLIGFGPFQQIQVKGVKHFRKKEMKKAMA